MQLVKYKICWFADLLCYKEIISECIHKVKNKIKQEPWRLPSHQAKFNGTDELRLDVHSDHQAVTGNQGYFEG